VNDFKAQLTHSFYGSFAYYPDKKQEVAHGAERHSVSSLENGAIFIPLSFFGLLFRQARHGRFGFRVSRVWETAARAANGFCNRAEFHFIDEFRRRFSHFPSYRNFWPIGLREYFHRMSTVSSEIARCSRVVPQNSHALCND
jgi:hypothetical protein